MKINESYYYQNIKQQAGFAAEIIGTAKENILAKLKGDNCVTYRADDRPDLFPRNDQYVDKIRMDNAGNILERIQVKFVGKNGAECLNKLLSKDYEKYLLDGKVDSVEIPSDYYDQIKNENLIQNKIADYTKQLEKVKELGKDDVARDLEAKINKCQKLDSMLKKSTVSSQEAVEARENGKLYTGKIFANKMISQSLKAGLDAGIVSAEISAAISVVDNLQKVYAGELSPAEAFVDVVKDTAVGGTVGGGTVFISSTISSLMHGSSHELIQSLSQTALPAAFVSFGVQSFDSVVDFAKGEIDAKQLAYDLGENAAKISGSMAGMAITTTAVAASGPVGIAAGLVGCVVGTAIAAEAYKSAVEKAPQGLDLLAAKAKELSGNAIDFAQQAIPESVDNLKNAFNDFASKVELPFGLGK